MDLFNYRGRNSDGSHCKGSLYAIDIKAAAKKLMEEDITPVTIRKSLFLRQCILLLQRKMAKMFPPSRKQIIRFCSEMSVLINSGLNVRGALLQMNIATKNLLLRTIIQEVLGKIDKGYALADAFSGYPKVFPKLFIAFLRQGDFSKHIAYVFEEIAESLHERNRIAREIATTITPFLSSFAMITLAGVLLSELVMPNIANMYSDKGAPMPLVTVYLISFFDFIKYSLTDFALVFGGIFFLFRIVLANFSEIFKVYWDQATLYIPIYNKFYFILAKINFAKSINMAIANGYPIQTVLKFSSIVVLNSYLRKKVLHAISFVESGGELSTAFRLIKFFSHAEIEILDVGIKAESLEGSFKHIIEFNENDFKQRLVILKEGLNAFIMFLTVFLLCFYLLGFYIGYLYAIF
jgi:MSHA biogenesis protein MshG